MFGLCASICIDFTRNGERIAALWLPNAIAIAILLRCDVPREKLILASMALGNLAANLEAGDPVLNAVTLSVANLAEIAVAVRLTRWLAHRQPRMEDITDLGKFTFAAALCAPILSGAIAASALSLHAGDWLTSFTKWVIADALSILIIAPSTMIVIDALRARRVPNRSEAIEWVVLTVAGTAATVAVFAQTTYPLLFLVPPIIVVHAFRLGNLGTAFSTITVAVIALAFTEMGMGPINLVPQPHHVQLVLLEAFLASSIFVGLPFASILATRARMTRQVKAQKAELALLTENVTDAILRFDTSGLCTYASPSTMAVLGAPRESFVGHRASDRSHPETAEHLRETERRLVTGETRKERFTYRRLIDSPDGEPVYIEADCAAVFDARTGEREGIMVSARDVTARVALERRLKRAMRHAENAAQAKAQFLANMSHEIRTPMNGVLGFADLLLRQGLKGEAARYAELIERSGRSMMALLNDILDISKIESGQLSITREPVDIRKLAAECAELHAAGANARNIAMAVRFGADVPACIASDCLRLRQILLNLIGNALKFTEQGSVEISIQQENGQLAIAVEDTGIGIEESRLDAVFSPFVQAEGETTRRYGGSGLGLSISRQLAVLLGGSLGADSMPGVGSRFTLRIPIAECDALPRTEGAVVSPSLAALPGCRVLLAEDHDVNRILVTAMLEQLGQTVEVAHDGIAAVEAASAAHRSAAPFDIVLMDIQMPGCDGYAATRLIRANGIDGTALPIIALTANAYAEDIEAAFDAGMQAHLAKPLVFEDLASTLARWLPSPNWPDTAGPHPQVVTDVTQAQPRGVTELWQARRREAIEAVTFAARGGPMDGPSIERLARIVHKLAGTAGMFGEQELGSRAAAFERALRSGDDAEARRKLAEELLEAA